MKTISTRSVPASLANLQGALNLDPLYTQRLLRLGFKHSAQVLALPMEFYCCCPSLGVDFYRLLVRGLSRQSWFHLPEETTPPATSLLTARHAAVLRMVKLFGKAPQGINRDNLAASHRGITSSLEHLHTLGLIDWKETHSALTESGESFLRALPN